MQFALARACARAHVSNTYACRDPNPPGLGPYMLVCSPHRGGTYVDGTGDGRFRGAVGHRCWPIKSAAGALVEDSCRWTPSVICTRALGRQRWHTNQPYIRVPRYQSIALIIASTAGFALYCSSNGRGRSSEPIQVSESVKPQVSNTLHAGAAMHTLRMSAYN